MLREAGVMPTIPTRDLNRARQFYETVLGFAPSDDSPEGIIFGTEPGKQFFLYQTQFAGTAQHTLLTWDVPDIHTEITDLRRRGVIFEEYDYPELKTVDGIAFVGNEWAAWFKDMDGNILAVSQRT